jgi:hypothetical protein
LLIEQVRNQQHQQPQTNTSVEENHV